MCVCDRPEEAQLLLVDEAAVVFVPRGAYPPASVPLPAAPAMRRLLARAPQWAGSAYVVTLAGGPCGPLRAALAARPGVLEATAGYTASAEAAAEGGMVEAWVEAVQLAVDPSVELTGLLEAFWAAAAAVCGGGQPPPACIFYHSAAQVRDRNPPPCASLLSPSLTFSHPACVFYHSAAQRDAAVASCGRQQGRLATRVQPAAAFWEAEPEHQARQLA